MQIEEIRRWGENRKQRAARQAPAAVSKPGTDSLELWALELLSLSLPASRAGTSTALPSLQSLAAPEAVPAAVAVPVPTPLSSALRHSQRSGEAPPPAGEVREPPPLERGFEIFHAERGGMGVVSFCLDRNTGFPFVIKTFREDLFLDRSETLPRFLAETRLWTELGTHPHIVRAYGTRLLGGRPYLFLELVPGPTLAELLKDHELSPADAIEAGLQICSALQHAGQRSPGFVHGDLKPSNLLVHERCLKVTDLGLARSAAFATGGGGTPIYMAPEQWNRTQLDARTDIYALGTVLYELLAGRPPFAGSELGDLRRAHREQAPAALQLAPTWQPLGSLVLRCLAKQPAQRPGLTELHDQLLQLRKPGQARQLRAWGPWAFVARGLYHLRELQKNSSIRQILGLGNALHDGVEETLRAQLAAMRQTPPDAADLERLRAFSRLSRSYPRAFVDWSGRGWNLSQLELAKQDLAQLCLPDAELAGKDLRGADLREADLRGADLRGADLRNADLRGADLREADLRGAQLEGADLRAARLEVARLEAVDLSQAQTEDAQFAWACWDDETRLPAQASARSKDFASGGLRLELWRGAALSEGLSPVQLGAGIAAQLRAGISTERFRADFDSEALRVLRKAVRIAGDACRDDAVRLEKELVALLQELWHTPLARDWLTLLVACDGQMVLTAQGKARLFRLRDDQLHPCQARHRSYQHVLPVRSNILTPRVGDVYVLGSEEDAARLLTTQGSLADRCAEAAAQADSACFIRVVDQPRLRVASLPGLWSLDFASEGSLMLRTAQRRLELTAERTRPRVVETDLPEPAQALRPSRGAKLGGSSWGLQVRSPDRRNHALLYRPQRRSEGPWKLVLRPDASSTPSWSVELDDTLDSTLPSEQRRRSPIQLCFSPDGAWLGVLTPGGEVSVYRVRDGRCRWRFSEDGPIAQLALDEGCRSVAYASVDGELLVWSAEAAAARSGRGQAVPGLPFYAAEDLCQ